MNNPARTFEFLRLWPGLASDPVSARAGEFYFNTTSNAIRYYNGTIWNDVGAGAFANKTLSNLDSPTSINQNLIADGHLTRTIGILGTSWSSAYVQSLLEVGSIVDAAGTGIGISTQAGTGIDPSGGLTIQTGPTVDGASGSVLIATGVPSGGTTVWEEQISSFGDVAFNFGTDPVGMHLAGPAITASASSILSSITFKLENATGTPDTFSVQVFVYSDNAGEPGGVIGQSFLTPVILAGSAVQDVNFPFTLPIPVSSGQRYYFLLTAQGTASTLNMLGDATDIEPYDFTYSDDSGSSWTTDPNPDPYFQIFSTPPRGSIDLNSFAARLMAQTPLRFMDLDNSNYVAFKAPAVVSTNMTWTLPGVDGTSGQAIVTDGAGLLSFATVTTPPSGAAGSIQFTDGSAFASDNAHLFWDDTNNRLGIGTNTPVRDVDIFSASGEPTLLWTQDSQAADNKRWQMTVSSGDWYLQALNDALSGDTALRVHRSGSSATAVSFGSSQNFYWNNTNSRLGILNTSPDERLHIGSFSNAADTYLKIAHAGGSLYKAGIKLFVFNDSNGFTLEEDDAGPPYGFRIKRHEASAPGEQVLYINRQTGRSLFAASAPPADSGALVDIWRSASNTTIFRAGAGSGATGGAIRFDVFSDGTTNIQTNAVENTSEHDMHLQRDGGNLILKNLYWPTADGSSGQALVTNGSGVLSFASVTTSPAGSNQQIQYNNAGAFAGASRVVTNGTQLKLGNGGSFIGTSPLTTYFTPGSTNGVYFFAGTLSTDPGFVIESDGVGITFGGANVGLSDYGGPFTWQAVSHTMYTPNFASGNTGFLNFSTGNAASGDSGNISLLIGTASGTQGSFKFLKSGIPSVSGQVWTASSTDGTGYWATPAAGGGTWEKETFTLSAGDITNGYIDLANVATNDTIDLIVLGGGLQMEGASYDYTVNYTGGAGGNTRITWVNDLAAALIAGDVLQVKYNY